MDAAKVGKSSSEDFRPKASTSLARIKQLDPKTFSSRRLTFQRSIGGYDDFLSTRRSDHEYEYGYEYDDNDYHGISIPFRWESQPGTPKHDFHSHGHNHHTTPLPPLTPPPSSFYGPTPRSTPRNNNKRCILLKTNYDLIRKILHSLKRPHSQRPSPSSPAASSSSYSSSSSFSTLRSPVSSTSSSRMMMMCFEEKQKHYSAASASRFSFESASYRGAGNIREWHRDRMYGSCFDEGNDEDYKVSSPCFGNSPASYFGIFKSATMIIPNKKKAFND